jgi:carbon monoxide dehydrogenase subunit G
LKVSLEKTFPLPASADQAWGLLQDVERVAACMPGARITERVDERHYKGTVAVRFGPANMSFRGEIEVAAIEPSLRTLRLVGKGTDTTGGSGASMELTARVDAVNDTSSTLVGNSDVSLSGKVAAFGGRMAESVAEQVLKQFVANFAAAVQTRQSSATAPPAAAAAAAASTTPGAAAARGADDATATAAPSPSGKTELNGLALIWGVLASWLRSLFHLRGA